MLQFKTYMSADIAHKKPFTVKIVSYLYLFLIFYCLLTSFREIFQLSYYKTAFSALDLFEYSFLKVPSVQIYFVAAMIIQTLKLLLAIFCYFKVKTGSSAGRKIGLAGVLVLILIEIIFYNVAGRVMDPVYNNLMAL